MKSFKEALSDGFIHVPYVADPKQSKELESEGVEVTEGYWSYALTPELEVCIEPCRYEGVYFVAIYKNRVKLTEKLMVKEVLEF